MKKKRSASVLVVAEPIRVPDLPFSGGATKMIALRQMKERYWRDMPPYYLSVL